MSFYVTFTSSDTAIENGCTEGEVRLGPFDEFVQLTYEHLRVGPEGDFIAHYSDVWYIEGYGNYSDVVVTYDVEGTDDRDDNSREG